MERRYSKEQIEEMAAQLAVRQSMYRKDEAREALVELVKTTSDIDGVSEGDVDKILEDCAPNIQNQPRDTEKMREKKPTKVLEIIARDAKKVVKAVRMIGNCILTYPLAMMVAAPTTAIKLNNIHDDEAALYCACGIEFGLIYTGVGYTLISIQNPRLALALGLTQLGTNAVSGIYEYVKHVREQMKK